MKAAHHGSADFFCLASPVATTFIHMTVHSVAAAAAAAADLLHCMHH